MVAEGEITWNVVVWATVTPDLENSIELDIREADTALTSVKNVNVDVYKDVRGKGDLENSVSRYAWRAGERQQPDKKLGATELETSLGDPDSCWGHDAKRLLVLWGHGARAFPEFKPRVEKTLAAHTPEAHAHLRGVQDGAELAGVFAGRRLQSSGSGNPAPQPLKPPDIVGYDACRMATLENVVALAASLKKGIFVGSMVPEPASGWPYFESLQTLTNDEPTAVASGLVEAYAAAVDTADWCMIALDLAKVRGLATAWGKLLARQAPSDTDFYAAAAGADIPDDTNFVDLGTLMRRLEGLAVGNAAKKVGDSLRDALVARRAGGSLVGRDGLAVQLALPPRAGKTLERFFPDFGQPQVDALAKARAGQSQLP